MILIKEIQAKYKEFADTAGISYYHPPLRNIFIPVLNRVGGPLIDMSGIGRTQSILHIMYVKITSGEGS